VLAALPAGAAGQRVGSEFRVNTYTTGTQRTHPYGGHLVAADATGNFVVVWTSFYQDGSLDGVFGQRYDSAGVPLGSEFRVNSYTTGSQGHRSVAAAADGDFVVVWRGSGQDAFGIFGQRYDSGGEALGSEFRVNSNTTLLQRHTSVGSDASGNFVVVWQSDYQDAGGGVFGQRYDSTGMAQGGEFRVNSYTTSFQGMPSVASDASGNFVVVWEGRGQGDPFGIFGQRYDSAGGTLGSEFRVNTYTTSRQLHPSVASDVSGNFVVTWVSYYQDGAGRGIFGQRYDSAGIAQGEEFRVNSYTTNDQAFASVASDTAGNFVVVWCFQGQGDVNGIFGQRYDSGGVAQGEEFQINSFITGAQLTPTVGATGINQFVVAWDSFGQDGSDYGVFGQRYDFSGTETITVVSPNTNVKWRIGSLQKIKWTHNLGHRAKFRIELDRDDDGDYEELIAAAAPADYARGSFTWTVTGPPSGTARVRVSWTDDPGVSDASDVTFEIRPAG
jgi:hypothetical protein